MDSIFALLLALSSCVNSHVFFFNPDSMNWTGAQTYCREHYTDLATIDDQADYDELVKTVPKGFTQRIWIGLYRTDGTAPWIWSNLSTSTFSLWESGQPNNYGGQQFCTATFVPGKWNDLECVTEYASVCFLEKKINTVRLEVKSGQNVNDPAVMTEILLQMEKILKESGMAKYAELSWKMQPDGNFFQKMIQRNVTQYQTCPLNRF